MSPRSHSASAALGVLIALSVAGSVTPSAAQQTAKPDRFADAVRAFARQLDNTARPTPIRGAAAEERQRGMWPTALPLAAAPSDAGPAASGAVAAQANLWYETPTLHTFRVLAEMLDDGRPRLAANGYVRDFFQHAPSRDSGLLAWGPELSLAIVDGSVIRTAPAGETAGHVLLARTPPWDILWDSNPEATQRAIAGLDLHFVSATGSRFAQRGPYFDAVRPAAPSGSCELAGVLTQSFAFLFLKTGEKRWQERSRACVDVAWNRRDPITQLIPDDLWAMPPEADAAEGAAAPPAIGSSRQALLGYFWLKAWREAPAETTWATQALAVIKAYDLYAYDRTAAGWRTTVRLDGQPLAEPPAHLAVWQTTPGQISAPQWGRIAAYAARTTQDKTCLDIAKRAAVACQKVRRPPDASPLELAHALHLSLDLYDLTQEKAYLDGATRLGDEILKTAFAGDLFRSGPGAAGYDARAGAGDVAAGLLRLHLRIHKFPPAKGYDWSF